MVIMKKLTYILSILLCALACGCSPDGGSSPLRGQWIMVVMTVDDQPVETAADLYTWRFHSDIVEITEQKAMHESVNYFGIWTLVGDAMTIDFKGQPGPPPELRLTGGSDVNHLTIYWDTKSQIILSGPTANYYLNKSN